MTDREPLEAFFVAGRETAPAPSDDLLRRVAADAAREQRPRVRPGRRIRLTDWFGELGGWPAMAGLAAATLAGLWIGAAGGLADLSGPGGEWDVEALSMGYADLSLDDG